MSSRLSVVICKIKEERLQNNIFCVHETLAHSTSNFRLAYTSISIALYHDSSLKRSGMARVNEGSHSFTCHPHVYPQVESTIPAFTPQPQSITVLWQVLVSRPAEGRRLSWPGDYCSRAVLLNVLVVSDDVRPTRQLGRSRTRRSRSRALDSCARFCCLMAPTTSYKYRSVFNAVCWRQ